MRGLRKGEYKEYNNAYIPYIPISPKPETKAKAKAEGRTKTRARARTFPHPGASAGKRAFLGRSGVTGLCLKVLWLRVIRVLWLRVKGSVAGGAYCVCWKGIGVLWLRVKGAAA